mmetsp:Transcript_8849/g.33418  ORF Transcript_8849/g.33418 Transcript_8849/m.33418 type:complete len:298 (-) Transcript_8849:644-1537(-)
MFMLLLMLVRLRACRCPCCCSCAFAAGVLPSHSGGPRRRHLPAAFKLAKCCATYMIHGAVRLYKACSAINRLQDLGAVVNGAAAVSEVLLRGYVYPTSRFKVVACAGGLLVRRGSRLLHRLASVQIKRGLGRRGVEAQVPQRVRGRFGAASHWERSQLHGSVAQALQGLGGAQLRRADAVAHGEREEGRVLAEQRVTGRPLRQRVARRLFVEAQLLGAPGQVVDGVPVVDLDVRLVAGPAAGRQRRRGRQGAGTRQLLAAKDMVQGISGHLAAGAASRRLGAHHVPALLGQLDEQRD